MHPHLPAWLALSADYVCNTSDERPTYDNDGRASMVILFVQEKWCVQLIHVISGQGNMYVCASAASFSWFFGFYHASPLVQ
jgi:membrane-bound inhibitor of C-type lysozyme